MSKNRYSPRSRILKLILVVAFTFLLCLVGAVNEAVSTTYEDRGKGLDTVGLYLSGLYLGDITFYVPGGYTADFCAVGKHKIAENTNGWAVPRYVDSIVCKIISARQDVKFIEVWIDWAEENRT